MKHITSYIKSFATPPRSFLPSHHIFSKTQFFILFLQRTDFSQLFRQYATCVRKIWQGHFHSPGERKPNHLETTYLAVTPLAGSSFPDKSFVCLAFAVFTAWRKTHPSEWVSVSNLKISTGTDVHAANIIFGSGRKGEKYFPTTARVCWLSSRV